MGFKNPALYRKDGFQFTFTRPKPKTAMTQLKTTHFQKSIAPEGHYWAELKRAISDTSGFKRWLIERDTEENKVHEATQDNMVQLYLRQTLETLAY